VDFGAIRHKTTNDTKVGEHPQPGRSLSPLLVRPRTDQSFEIIAVACAAQMVETQTVPVRIVNLSDAEALEAQLIELSIVVKKFFSGVARLHVVYM